MLSVTIILCLLKRWICVCVWILGLNIFQEIERASVVSFKRIKNKYQIKLDREKQKEMSAADHVVATE